MSYGKKLAPESVGELKSVWSPAKRRKVSRKLAVGDRVQLYYTYDNDEGEKWEEMYDAVVSKVNLKTFKAVCEGEETDLIHIELERGPKYPAGLWCHAQGPVVDEVEFEVFKMLHSMVDEVASVQEEPESLEGVVRTEGHTGVWA